MCFDVLKVVRSPGCDHGHDEESRNGRDIKIDILDGYIRTPEVFRVISEKTGVPEGYQNPPPPRGEVMGLMGLSGESEGQPGGATRPSPSGLNWTRRGGAAPPFLLPLPLPFPLLVGVGKRGVLLLLGGGLLLLVPCKGRPASPLAPLYTGAGGTSRHNN